ncbi:hypothetical protein KCP78_24970 [Salmonella enterica subsp. enterica]|nr:hypothetical protein KCP78_24970 [Salmonella enterica subsp. enterica]
MRHNTALRLEVLSQHGEKKNSGRTKDKTKMPKRFIIHTESHQRFNIHSPRLALRAAPWVLESPRLTKSSPLKRDLGAIFILMNAFMAQP